MSKFRAWCFTANNYTDNTEAKLKQLHYEYLVYGREKAPTTGTPHLQGYVYLVNQRTLSSLRKDFPKIRWAIAKGTGEQNRTYCTKEGNFFEDGEVPQQGKRTDISEIRDLVDAGGSMRDVLSVASSYQSARMGELLIKYRKPPPASEKVIKWFWGPTGTGKTRKAVEEAGDDVWISSRNLKWWDGYCGEENVIFDDFRADFCTFHELLRITDRYPFRAEVKGGSIQINVKNIWITSAYNPEDVYSGRTSEDIQQLLRRITKIEHFGSEVKGNNNLDLLHYSI